MTQLFCDKICPFCGAYSPKKCDFDGPEGAECPWEIAQDFDDDIEKALSEDDVAP